MQTTAGKTEQTQRTAGTFTRRIGSTTYRVGVHFSRTNKETANDKIARLVRSDNGAPTPTTPLGWRGERRSDGASELSGLPESERYEVRDDEKVAMK